MRTTPEKPGSRDQESEIREGGRVKDFDVDFEWEWTKSTQSYGVHEIKLGGWL
jgi:hypothetical protein